MLYTACVGGQPGSQERHAGGHQGCSERHARFGELMPVAQCDLALVPLTTLRSHCAPALQRLFRAAESGDVKEMLQLRVDFPASKAMHRLFVNSRPRNKGVREVARVMISHLQLTSKFNFVILWASANCILFSVTSFARRSPGRHMQDPFLALHKAAARGHWLCVLVLIHHGADPNAVMQVTYCLAKRLPRRLPSLVPSIAY